MIKQGSRMMLDKGAQEAVSTYMADLEDLTVNSKPHINALTMLAEDYLNYAEAIVKAVDDHLSKVGSNVKLPILYLIDSIIKNVGKDYIDLFARRIVQSFCKVFEQVDEKNRQQMYKLRQTWNDIFSQEDLYAMDLKVHAVDPKWPITAAPSQSVTSNSSATHTIHINPRFLQTRSTAAPVSAVTASKPGKVSPTPSAGAPAKTVIDAAAEVALREQLLQKKRDLLQLQQERVDLELSQMKAKLDKKQKAVSKLNEKTSQEVVPVNVMKEKSVSPNAVDEVPIINLEESEKAKEVKDNSKKTSKPESIKLELAASHNPPQIPAHSNNPRIAPVSSGLVNLITSQRAQRDPRLSKQVKEEIVIDDSEKSQGKTRDPRLTTKSDKRSRSSDKESSIKRSRSSDKEPSVKRSRSSDKEPSAKRSRSSDKELSTKSSRRHVRDGSSERSSRHSSRREERDKRPSESRKSSRKSEEHSVSRSKKTSSRSPSKSSSKHERRGESSRSPKKSSYLGHRPVSDCADSTESDVSDSKGRGVSPLSPHAGTLSNSSDWAVSYTKGSHKGRNYVRRNRQKESPEVVCVSSDVDLRVSGPPEKQPGLSTSSEGLMKSSLSTLSSSMPEQILPTIACQDVDLRRISSPPGKKRCSAEPEDGPPPNKKNKAAYLEMLFGNQDVDLRQLDISSGITAVEAPSPPPPPIISSPDRDLALKDGPHGWSTYKQAKPSPTIERSPAFPRSSRHDRLGRSTGDDESGLAEDTDMRLPMNGFGSSKTDYQAILNTAAEQFKNKTISYADYSKVQKQVIRMHECEKIREAQRNDYTRRDAWERRPQRERDYKHGRSSPESEQFGDIDERIAVGRPLKKPLLPNPSMPPLSARLMGQRMPPPIQGQGFMRPHRPLLGQAPRGHPRGMWRNPRMGPGFRFPTISLPLADVMVLQKIAHDTMKTITIDGIGREIRFYGDDAVVFLGAEEPRFIAFDPGDATVIINDVVVHCSFHQPAKEVNVGGKVYGVRLGAPTRELYINNEGFECQFGCPPKQIRLSTGEVLLVQLQSDVEIKVQVGDQCRHLVAGRIMLVIDAEFFIPIYLDAKPQRFDIDGVPHIIKFADALETVLVNDHPFNIQFGGPPVPITVNNRRHHIRLTELPPDVTPGEVNIVSMSHVRTKPPSSASPWPMSTPLLKNPARPHIENQTMGEEVAEEMNHGPDLSLHEPALPVRGAMSRIVPKKIMMKPKLRRDREPEKANRVEDRTMPPELFQALQPGLPTLLGLLPCATTVGYSSATASKSGTHDLQGAAVSASATASLVTSSVTAPAASSSDPAPAPESAPTNTSGSNGIPFLAPDLNIHKLFQSLHDAGVFSSMPSLGDSKKDKVKEEEEDKKKIHEVDFKDPPSLKVKQPGIIDILYSGIQCSSCGTRFPPEQTEKYSSHLDWHFRQNRRDKDSAKKPQSRRWFYDISDWIQFEEIDDTVDKAQNWFDTQQSESAKFEETEEEEIQSIPSSEFKDGAICELCHDKFEQFYNEDKEEWHLRDCLVADGLPYHPFCYKDYRVSVESNDEEQNVVGDEHIDEAVKNSTEEEASVDEIKKEADGNNIKEEIQKGEEKIETEEEGTEKSAEVLSVKQEESTDVIIKEEVSEDVINSCTEPEEQRSVKIEAEVDEEEELNEEEKLKETNDGLETPCAAESDDADAMLSKTSDDTSALPPVTNSNSAVVSCSIDGNLELTQASAAIPPIPNRIKINISKPIILKPTESEDIDDEPEKTSENGDVDNGQGLPETAAQEKEPIVLKPKLVGRKLTELPPKLRGTEASGLCSIM